MERQLGILYLDIEGEERKRIRIEEGMDLERVGNELIYEHNLAKRTFEIYFYRESSMNFSEKHELVEI